MVRIKAKYLKHGGVLGAGVQSVSGTTLVSTDTIDGTSVDNWTGRVLGIIGRDAASVPYAFLRVTAFAPLTGTYTLDRSATGIVSPGDVFVLCFKGYDNSANPLSIIDAGIENVSNRSGMALHSEQGYMLRVIAGLGRGTPPLRIVDSSATGWTLDSPGVTIDATSVWIIEGATWSFSADSAEYGNASASISTTLSMNAQNWVQIPMVVAGFQVDVNGIESPDNGNAPVRMLWTYGAQGTRTITASQTGLTTDRIVNIDATAADVTYTIPPFSQIPNQDLDFLRLDASAHVVTILCSGADLLSGVASRTLAGAGSWLKVTIPHA